MSARLSRNNNESYPLATHPNERARQRDNSGVHLVVRALMNVSKGIIMAVKSNFKFYSSHWTVTIFQHGNIPFVMGNDKIVFFVLRNGLFTPILFAVIHDCCHLHFRVIITIIIISHLLIVIIERRPRPVILCVVYSSSVPLWTIIVVFFVNNC